MNTEKVLNSEKSESNNSKKIIISKIYSCFDRDNYSWSIKSEIDELSNAMQTLGFDEFAFNDNPSIFAEDILPEVILRE